VPDAQKTSTTLALTLSPWTCSCTARPRHAIPPVNHVSGPSPHRVLVLQHITHRASHIAHVPGQAKSSLCLASTLSPLLKTPQTLNDSTHHPPPHPPRCRLRQHSPLIPAASLYSSAPLLNSLVSPALTTTPVGLLRYSHTISPGRLPDLDFYLLSHQPVAAFASAPVVRLLANGP
jgi:hypothetical protein